MIMTFRFAVLLAVALFSFGIESSCSNDELYFIAKGFEERSGVGEFFGIQSNEQIESLTYHENLKVSLFAAWIRCKRRCLDAKELGLKDTIQYRHEFIGFLSGKLNLPIPEWWQDHILRISIASSREVPKLSQWKKYSCFINTNGVFHNRRVEVSHLTDTRIRGRLDKKAFDIPWDREATHLSKELAFFDIAKARRNQRVFAVTDRDENDFTVYCVTDHGQELWRATISPTRHYGFGGTGIGDWNGLMEIGITNNMVAVFGVNTKCIYVDTFSLTTGEVISRFSTLY